jgi:hypothetical protein
LEIRRAWLEEGGEKLYVFLDCFDGGKSLRPQQRDLEKFEVTLGGKKLDVKADFYKDNNAIVFLVDASNTLTLESFNLAKQGVERWLERMQPGDQAAIISFGSRTEVLSDFIEDTQILREILRGIQQIDKKLTDPPDSCLYQAVSVGMNKGNRKDAALPNRRVVVAFTSGVRTSGGTTQETLRREIIPKNPTPVYAVLFDYAGRDIQEGPTTQISLRNQFIDIVRESGGAAETYVGVSAAKTEDEKDSTWEKVMEEHFALFENLIKISVDVSSIELIEGVESILEVKWLDGTRIAADTKNIPFSIKPLVSPPTTERTWLIAGLCLSAMILLAAGRLWIWKNKKAKDKILISNGDAADEGRTEIQQHTPLEPLSPNLPEIVLTTISDAANARVYRMPFQGSVIIGRSSGAGILTIFGDDHISGKHCEIFEQTERFMIRDLNSTNGTIVNGAALSANHPVAIDHGNVVTIGVTRLRVNLPRSSRHGEPHTKRVGI